MIRLKMHVIRFKLKKELSSFEENYLKKLDLILSQKDNSSALYIQELSENKYSLKFKSSYLTFSNLIKSKENLMLKLEELKKTQNSLRVPPLHKIEEEYQKKMSNFFLKDRDKARL